MDISQTSKELLDSIELQADTYETISKAIEQLKGVCRLRQQLDMPTDNIVNDIVKLSDIRLSYLAAKAIY